MTRAEQILDFRADLRAAAELREDFFARDFDAASVDDDWRIYYAIDSSVLYHVFSDDALGWSDEADDAGTHKYKIFSGPRDDADLRDRCDKLERKFGTIVSNFLLDAFEATEGASALPLLILSGHDIETGNLYSGIVREFASQRNRLQRATDHARQLEALGGEIQESGGERTEAFNAIADNLFNELYRINLPHEQFQRFNQLARAQRLLTLKAAAHHRDFATPSFRFPKAGHVFATTSGDGETADEKGPFTDWWNSSLHQKLPKRFRENDRFALETLDRLNRRLAAKRIRILLFTDNERIIQAGRYYFPFKYVYNTTLQEVSFSDLYLRHPRCLLAEAGLARPGVAARQEGAKTPRIEVSLDELFNAVLEDWGDFASPRHRMGTWLAFRRVIWARRRADGKLFHDSDLAAALQKNPTIHTSFVEKWANYIGDLATAHASSSELAVSRLKNIILGEDKKGIIGVVDRIRKWVNRLTEASWSDFFITAADMGLELIKVSEGDEPPVVRPIPQLVVRSSAGRALRAMWTAEDVKRRMKEVMRTIGALPEKKDLEQSYIQALGYGVIFASVNRWHLTRLLAQRAIQLCEELRARPAKSKSAGSEPLDVREAWYLLAMAERIVGDPGAARDALVKAKEESVSAEVASADWPQLTGLRLDVEELEIAAAGLVDADTGPKMKIDERDRYEDSLVDLARASRKLLSKVEACEAPAIRLQAALAIRSIHFEALALLAESGQTKMKVIRGMSTSEFARLVRQQVDDIKKAYKDDHWLPLRDRVLLHCAASICGERGLLDDNLARPFGQVLAAANSSEHALSGADRRMLARIEAVIARNIST